MHRSLNMSDYFISHLSQLSDFNLSNASPSKIGESVFVVFFMLEIQLINDTTSLIIAF